MTIWDKWEKKRRRRLPIFPDVERMIDEMEKEMAEFFKEIDEKLPDESASETVLPEGSIKKEHGPFVYGYSVKIGSDGKPVVREFGNLKPDFSAEAKKPYSLQEAREPIIDVIEELDQIKVVTELPGVEKNEIDLYTTNRTLTINVNNPHNKYYKQLDLPCEVDEASASSTYRNGVLETVLKRKGEKGPGKNIKIE
jgi:HSP20 family protein